MSSAAYANSQAEQRVLLGNISWELFLNLAESAASPRGRFANGVLQRQIEELPPWRPTVDESESRANDGFSPIFSTGGPAYALIARTYVFTMSPEIHGV